MLSLDNHPPCLYLRMVDHLINRVDRTHWDALCEQENFPFLIGLGQKNFLEFCNEGVAVLDPGSVCGITRIIQHLFHTEDGTEKLPEFVTAHSERQVCGFGTEGLIG